METLEAGYVDGMIFRRPRPVGLDQRLAAFPVSDLPLERPVTIRWNEHAIPWITAETDGDAAFALGLVHAHLREAQIAIGKRASQGRLSEIGGRFAVRIDAAIRTLDIAAAVPAIEAALPEATRVWLTRFVEGLNHYTRHAGQPPPEFRLLGIRREPTTVADVLTAARLVSLDITWGFWFGLLRAGGDREALFKRGLAARQSQWPSYTADGRAAVLERLLAGYVRSGSNCVVVAPGRSATGHAMLASDPHLSKTVPNFWLLAGVRCPSLHVVGMMPPGLPIFGLGRNAAMAWGGTNMHAQSSDLYDVSGEPPDSFTSRQERIRVRFGRTRTVTVRRSRLGPVLSDVASVPTRPGEVLALRWVGHAASDETSAFLAAAQATTPNAFRAAFAPYAVAGQNMMFATADGHVGQILAVALPERSRRMPERLVLDAGAAADDWGGVRPSPALPWSLDPPEGVLASANNVPTELDIPIGQSFGAPERVRRLYALLGAAERLTVADLKRLQTDVLSTASADLAAGLVARLDAAGVLPPPALRGWDGDYQASAAAPVAFETLLYHVAHGVCAPPGGKAPADKLVWAVLRAFLLADLDALPERRRQEVLATAVRKAAADARKFATWGDMHRQPVQSLLAAIPLIGAWFRHDTYPTGGSRETVFNSGHGLVRAAHRTTFGSQSRFVADLSDLDASEFILFGGQDGWIGSANALDMMPAWRAGGYVRLPLRPETVVQTFSRVMTLTPRA